MENVNVPYNTKIISSCLECPYHKMYSLSRTREKIICTQTNEEVEVEDNDIEYFSIMSMCPYKQKASTENEIAKLSMFIPANTLIITHNEMVLDKINEIIDKINELNKRLRK